MFTSVLFSLFGGLALFRLRLARPEAPRPYRVWGYPILPGLFVLGSVFVVVNTLMTSARFEIAGIGLRHCLAMRSFRPVLVRSILARNDSENRNLGTDPGTPELGTPEPEKDEV